MRPRTPARKRFLGLWTAGWLGLLLVLAMLRFGDPAVQWPVLLVPALWALVALRPRRRSGRAGARRAAREPETLEAELFPDDGQDDDPRYDDARYDDSRYDDARYGDARYDDDPPTPPPGMRTDTVERPALRGPSDDRDDDRW
ncbi:hypothetical protein GCU60_07060 [Blastococcus saxobsidens]|uniref:Uncharacterized protein n=1 Tax=Blastococcus saxobsidens TaxID=138336 RepID=A0A6L9W1B7_9ACTN|nr:hypothetical protein [Blastococcus saxobsidens]NEK85519.1 hypothetical protein [Blastococcus saxobsidens]